MHDIERLTLALVVAAAVAPRSAAKSLGTFAVGWRPCSCRIPHACSWDLQCIIVAPSQSFLLRSFARHGAIKVAIQVIKSVSSTLNRTLFFSKIVLAAKYPSMRFRWTLTHDI